MRVRPFFWCLLAVACISVLLFAATIHTHAPTVMRVHFEQQPPTASVMTTLKLHLTDQEGLPIEWAQVVPSAKMTNMDMTTDQVRVQTLGQGDYLAQLQLYMAGPWEIRIVAEADGFDPAEQTFLVQVQ